MGVKLTRGLIVRGTNGGEFEAEPTEYPARRISATKYEIAFSCCGKTETAIVSSEFVYETTSGQLELWPGEKS